MLNALPRTPLTRARGIAIALALAAGSGSPFASPRIAAAQRSQAPRATGSTTAILVDVVVRDKNGEPVPGLTPEDFEIIEDGVRQELGSFTPIFRDAPGAAVDTTIQTPATTASTGTAASQLTAAAHKEAAAQATAAVNAPEEILTLVFDRLTADNRPLAQRAALAYLSTDYPTAVRSRCTVSIWG